MSNRPSQLATLLTARSRHIYSMQISTAISLFFMLAWCLLQWSLAAGEQFADNAVARRFAEMEAQICLFAAACAAVGLIANAAAWAGVQLRLRCNGAGGNISHRIPALG